jgi:PTS system beta-glucosides-specific IIC component
MASFCGRVFFILKSISNEEREKSMDYESVAKKILQRVGGAENVTGLVHCMTRLRFNLKDESIVDDEAVKKTKGVMGVMKKGGQYQIIIGNDVGYVYEELNKLGKFSNQVPKKKENSTEKKNILTMLMDTISGIMTPVIPAIIGAAMIKVLLTLLPMIGVLNTSGDTYQLLTVIGDGAFFFMPVLIAVSASKKFGTNVYYAASIALIMLHPNFISMMTTAHDANETIRFLGLIPVTYATYSYSVIPIILAVWSLKYVEKFVDKITPVITKNFLKPMLVVLIEAPIALIILGPLGAICGNVLSEVVYFIHDKLGFIAVGLVAGIYPFVVMAGMHHAFTPIKLGMIATTGYENFICIGELCSNMAQGAASLAVAIKSKNKDFKQIAGSSAFSALLAGITEPALYGVTLRLKRPMLGACIGAVAGGLFGGFFQLKCFGIATPAIVTIVQYVEESRPMSLLIAALTILITVIVAFIATMLIGFEDVVDEDDEEEYFEEVKEEPELTDGEEITVLNPLAGEIVSLNQVKDATFSQEILGKGVAVVPAEGVVYAPFDGKVDMMFETGHAVGLTSDKGVELLIHVGIDTVNLKGQYFHPMKKTGDEVKKGDVLLTFEKEKIEQEYDLMTPVIISNTNRYQEIKAVKTGKANVLDSILTIR